MTCAYRLVRTEYLICFHSPDWYGQGIYTPLSIVFYQTPPKLEIHQILEDPTPPTAPLLLTFSYLAFPLLLLSYAVILSPSALPRYFRLLHSPPLVVWRSIKSYKIFSLLPMQVVFAIGEWLHDDLIMGLSKSPSLIHMLKSSCLGPAIVVLDAFCQHWLTVIKRCTMLTVSEWALGVRGQKNQRYEWWCECVNMRLGLNECMSGDDGRRSHPLSPRCVHLNCHRQWSILI